MFFTGTLELRLPGSTKLIGARCIGSVLETVETLHNCYSLVCTSICLEVLNVRADWQSGFVSNLELQAEAPAVSYTSGWPYFQSSGPIEVKVEDCYVACIVTYLELLAPVAFSRLTS